MDSHFNPIRQILICVFYVDPNRYISFPPLYGGAFKQQKEQHMAKKPESRLTGRDARTGQFIPVEQARNHPNTTVVERLPLPGKGK